MKKILILTFMFMMIAANCFAFFKVDNEQAILEDMYSNPYNYIYYGAASTGFSFYYYKPSVDVQKYEPPNYIIAIRSLTRHTVPGENITSDRIIRFKYNYDSRKMWIETRDEDSKNLIWKDVDPTKSKNYHDDNLVAAGEVLFYLAYKMSFFDKPVTKPAKDIVNGNPIIYKPYKK